MVNRIARIDVDDVSLTLADGSKLTQRGTYSVRNTATGYGVLDVTPSTNTGVDVMPGTYEVVVTYRSTGGHASHVRHRRHARRVLYRTRRSRARAHRHCEQTAFASAFDRSVGGRRLRGSRRGAL